MNPIKQYLKEREEELEKGLVKDSKLEHYEVDETVDFVSKTIKGLIGMLVKEEKVVLHEHNSIPCTIDGLEDGCILCHQNLAKQETIDRLLELIK